VIKGWDLGLMGMKVGGKRRLKVPAHLAYGERQVGALIKPNSDLEFEIELLEVLTRDD
jgi:peptidylprolyl isomerase